MQTKTPLPTRRACNSCNSLMDWGNLNYYCPRCYVPVDLDSGFCPVCPMVVPATGWDWPTIQAHNGDVRSPPHASALENATNISSPVYTRTYPTPDAPDKIHRLDPPTQPLPPSISGSSNHRERQRSLEFIHHSGPQTSEPVKTTRACMSCYNSVKCNPGPNPECCGPCRNKNRYCRGPIDAPVLIDTHSWFKNALASLQSQCSSLETIVKERSIYALSIKVNKTGALEEFDVDLQNLDSHVVTPQNSPSLARVLDVVFPTDQRAGLNAGSLASRHTPDDNIESVVRRFVACAMLLCSIALSGIDQSEYEHAAAPYVSLAFIRRLSQEACDLFHCVFNKAHEFANLKSRNKLTFVRDKRSFAFDLGLVYSSVQSLISTNGNWAGSHSMPGNLYDIKPAVLEKLEWLAMGFNRKEFIEGRHGLGREPTEVHIGLSPLQRRLSISNSSSTQAHSHGDNLIRNAPSLDSPIAQDSAGQSPGQVPDSNFIQHSGKIMAGRSSTFPRLFRELDRLPQDDLNNIPLSPVQSQCSNDDLIEHARTELKEHVAAITKHLIKKAALEEKLKVWQLDSAVSNGIVDSDGCGGNPLQSGLAIEKRIRELKEASKQQDVAIQKHHIRRADLEKRIEHWKLNLAPVPAQNDVANHHPLLPCSMAARSIDDNTRSLQLVPEGSYSTSLEARSATPMRLAPVAPLTEDSSEDSIEDIREYSCEDSIEDIREYSCDGGDELLCEDQIEYISSESILAGCGAQHTLEPPEPPSMLQQASSFGPEITDTCSSEEALEKLRKLFTELAEKFELVDINGQTARESEKKE